MRYFTEINEEMTTFLRKIVEDLKRLKSVTFKISLYFA